ncbi:hypothetical protein V6S67_10340 [Arthrobacter sp. Soc17.1.1.1]|uniref:hypothetical protein n=1 Tax=Arthrobacter sp. Soc17.1.1.1 TaxID=3121277 RepID=UPI002FE4CC68
MPLLTQSVPLSNREQEQLAAWQDPPAWNRAGDEAMRYTNDDVFRRTDQSFTDNELAAWLEDDDNAAWYNDDRTTQPPGLSFRFHRVIADNIGPVRKDVSMKLTAPASVPARTSILSHMNTLARGEELNESYWIFEQDSDSEHWTSFLDFLRVLGKEPTLTPSFTNAEIAGAEWCEWITEWNHGYPQPEHDFNYRKLTYDLSGACSVCSRGFLQNAPYRMRNEPRWGRRSVLQMFWVYDAWFVKPEVYESVFKRFGVASRVVLRKGGEPLTNVVQLVVDEIVPVNEYRTAGEFCDICGHFKLHAAQAGYSPLPAVRPEGPLAHSEAWYGSGGMAFRLTFMRQDLVAAVRAAGLRGTSFQACKDEDWTPIRYE